MTDKLLTTTEELTIPMMLDRILINQHEIMAALRETDISALRKGWLGKKQDETAKLLRQRGAAWP